jgi:catechol 2,3-dioxygenase-like lactoylglutathione lyase family enzyme
MTMRLTVFTLFVNDRDQALRFYVDRLGFVLSEDRRLGDYRWLLVCAPPVARRRHQSRTGVDAGSASAGRETGRRQAHFCAGDR